jgi:lipopolysaccharide transport system permease protein
MLTRIARSMARASLSVVAMLYRHRRVLVATTRVEVRKRYAGSALGLVWVGLYPVLLLCVYLFVFLVLFRTRLPGFSEMDYVLYVFAGLIPYMGLSEAVQAGTQSIKQNLHLIKNVMLPIELVPVRAVAAALVGQSVSLVVLVVLAAANGTLSPAMVFLPLVFLLQFLMLIGIVFVLSAAAVVVQDISYLVTLTLMLLMFLSPIGFRVDMLPPSFGIIVWANPVAYLLDAYRAVLLTNHPFSLKSAVVFCTLATIAFVFGAAFFSRFKGVLVDHE